MKTILYKLEIKLWDIHIHFLDKNRFARTTIPRLWQVIHQRDKLMKVLSWSAIGFPIGVILEFLKVSSWKFFIQ